MQAKPTVPHRPATTRAILARELRRDDRLFDSRAAGRPLRVLRITPQCNGSIRVITDVAEHLMTQCMLVRIFTD